MKNKVFIICALLGMIFFLSGCSGHQQLHQKLVVQGVGIDKSEKGYTVTVQALDFQNPMSEDEPTVKVIETQGQSVTEALDNISKRTSLRPVYSQNLILILGKNAASAGVGNFIDFFIRHCETRPKVEICVTKEKASDILRIKSGDKMLKSKNIHDLIPAQLNSDVLHFVSNLKNSNSDPWTAWLEIEDKKGIKEVSLKGVGIFNRDKLLDFLEGEDAFGFMILKGVPNFGSCVINLPEGGEITCIIDRCVPEIKSEVQENDLPRIEVNLNVSASTFSVDKDSYTHSFEEVSQAIEKELERKIGDICNKVLQKTLNLNLDLFEFSKILRNNHPSYFKKIQEKYKPQLNKLKFEVKAKVKLKATGKEPV